ncbi:MAG: DNA-deoxyinosine glycosylase [Blautia sp.]|jgi:TDG/mug DNA glycosylase family protein
MEKQSRKHVEHEFLPVYDQASKVLILGTFPSVKSREGQFYYHHPRNRFWPVLSRLTGEPLPESIPEKKEMLLRHGISIWDVVASCDITGSSDSSIRNVVPADIGRVLEDSQITEIYTNGGTAHRLYQKYCLENTGLEDVCLPSTSPANAAFSLEKLVEIWGRYLLGKIN